MQSIKNQVKKLYRMYNRAILLYRFRKKVHNLNAITDSYGLNKEPREKEIIVSLTSYPARLNNLHYTVKSILCQSLRPDKLILYLGDDCIYENLPDSLRELERYGLQIFMKPGNLKPHKKYYYAIKENPDSLIITIDDDCIYSLKMIQELYSTYQKFPNCVVALRGHRILFDEVGKIKNYMDWEWEYQKENCPSIQIIATGGAGALYPPGLMEEEYLFQTELIQTLSPTADDLWLKTMQVLKGTKVVLCDWKIEKERINFDVLLNEQTGSLQAENVHQNMNNVYMKRLMEHFKLTKDNFIDEI
ncbi:MAG: glycosyltransferase family 2 protein [Lachnospiraceae bacterium]|nr:glycosyltransferase family 2 protein [Lachnospiraceae bacterium]MCI8825748.1 glycosyltransferase family 2 protein [Lachnospiraceae bacterium]MCI9371280.1 glycosyltransferase family 2 protein [Lachnospiraceae bacterium]